MWPFSKQQTPAVTPPAAAAIGDSVDLNRLNADLAKEYVRSIYLWRCVDMIASMASSVPLEVEKEDETQLTPPQIAVGKLLVRPNPQWTGAALQYWAAASLAVSNKAYLLRVRGTGNVTLELWPLSPHEVVPIYRTNSRIIERFDVTTGGKIDQYPVDENGDSDVIFIRKPALNHYSDKSPAHIAAAPAEVFTRILQRCADIVSNSSNMTGLLSTESEMAETALLKIKDKITQFRTGQTQSGGTLVTSNAKWAFTRLAEDPTSALSVEIKDSLARDVVMTFGVPTQLVGLPGTDTYNNLAMARVGFLTDCVLPGYINLYVAGLNHALMNGNGAYIEPDMEDIPAMIAARQQLTDTASKATMLSVNEQREMLGYSEFDDPNEEYDADVPVKLLELKLKRLAIEVQGGNVANVLREEPT